MTFVFLPVIARDFFFPFFLALSLAACLSGISFRVFHALDKSGLSFEDKVTKKDS